MANEWDVTKPADHTLNSLWPQKIKDLRSSAKIVISKEHVTLGDANAGGQHLKGAARVFLQSGLAANDPEGNTLATANTSDDGRLNIDTSNSNLLKVYVSTSAGVSTGFEDVKVANVEGIIKATAAIDANKNEITNLKGNTFITGRNNADDGTVNIIKVNASDKLELGAVLLDNEPSTAAAPTVNGQLANKKYVDDQMQSSVVELTGTDLSNTSGVAADITGATKTITTVGGNVLLIFSTTIKMTAGETQLWFDVDAGTAKGLWIQKVTSNASIINMSYLVTGLSAASHTFKVRWQDVSGDVYINGSTDGVKTQLIVQEIPA